MSEVAKQDFNHLPPGAAGLGRIFARPRWIAALCVVVLTALGWFYLAIMLSGMSGAFGGYPTGIVQALCRPLSDASWSADGVVVIASMWVAMTLAMMLPSAAPMIMTYAGIADTAASKGERIVSPLVLASGYIVVWFGFAFIVTLMQVAMAHAALLNASMTPANGFLSGAIFVVAGLHQFSALKNACLARCQNPFPFFFANWTTSPAGVFRLGLKQGLFCLGCCWAMMLVMFAIGLMNIIWMTAVGIVMTIEKLQTGRRFTHIVGVVFVVTGLAIVGSAFAGHWPVRLS